VLFASAWVQRSFFLQSFFPGQLRLGRALFFTLWVFCFLLLVLAKFPFLVFLLFDEVGRPDFVFCCSPAHWPRQLAFRRSSEIPVACSCFWSFLYFTTDTRFFAFSFLIVLVAFFILPLSPCILLAPSLVSLLLGFIFWDLWVTAHPGSIFPGRALTALRFLSSPLY